MRSLKKYNLVIIIPDTKICNFADDTKIFDTESYLGKELERLETECSCLIKAGEAIVDESSAE